MTICDCLGNATLAAPVKRNELFEPVSTSTRYLRAADLLGRIPVAADTVDHEAATYVVALPRAA